MKLVRTLIFIGIVVGLAYAGATVKLGQRTFFGHIEQIWASDEARELVEGVKETSKPVVERIKRGVKAGGDAAAGPDPDSADSR